MATRFVDKYAGASATDAPISRSGAAGVGFDTLDNQWKYHNGTLIITPIHDNGIIVPAARMPLYNPTPKAIVDASATSLFDVALPANGWNGGVIHYTVVLTDATDFQALTGMVTYAAVSKATVQTLTIVELATNQAKAVSSGTLTLAWTFVAGTLKGTVKVQPTGSLTETTFQITYNVTPIVGAVTLL